MLTYLDAVHKILSEFDLENILWEFHRQFVPLMPSCRKKNLVTYNILNFWYHYITKYISSISLPKR